MQNEMKFLSAPQLAEALNLPENWVRWQTFIRGIPSHKFGKYRRYVLEEVLTSLEAQQNKAS